MKGLSDCRELFHASLILRLSVLAVASVVAFYLVRHWSDASPQLVFYTSSVTTSTSPSSSIAISPNANATFDIPALVSAADAPPPLDAAPETLPSPAPPSPPPPPKRFGVVDGTGAMSEDFEVRDVDQDPDPREEWDDEAKEGGGEGKFRARAKVQKFRKCPVTMMDYIPCLDNEEAIKNLTSTEKGERFERHCPPEGKGLGCLIPPPKNYRNPIPWPRSRDEVFPSLSQ